MHQSTPVSMPRGKFVDAEALCGPVGISRFGKPCVSMPRKVDGAVLPLVAQRLAADAADVDAVVRAGDGVEAGGVDDDVELVVALGGAQARLGDPLDRRLADIDEVHVVAVVGLEVVGLERHALHAEAVIPRDQLLRDLGILDAAADAVGDVVGELGVGRLVDEDLAEIAQPDAEAGLVVELVPQREPLLARHLVEAAAIGLMHEAAGRARAGREDLVVARADVGHLLRPRSALLLSGALQFGRRWNTVSSPTLSAISPMIWMPVAPVPMTATFLPASSTGSCGQ